MVVAQLADQWLPIPDDLGSVGDLHAVGCDEGQ